MPKDQQKIFQNEVFVTTFAIAWPQCWLWGTQDDMHVARVSVFWTGQLPQQKRLWQPFKPDYFY